LPIHSVSMRKPYVDQQPYLPTPYLRIAQRLKSNGHPPDFRKPDT